MGEMLNDLIFSVNTILPVFIVVAIGYFMRRRGTVDEHFVGSISNVVFYYALPARMFLDVAGSDFTELMNPRFILVTVGGTIGVFLLAWLVISHCIHDRKKIAAAVHSAYRGNYIYIGLPIIECPEAAKAIAAGDEVEVDFDSGVITDKTTGQSFQGQAFPEFMQKIITAGGLVNYINQK